MTVVELCAFTSRMTRKAEHVCYRAPREGSAIRAMAEVQCVKAEAFLGRQK
jgi:hypothetical protein